MERVVTIVAHKDYLDYLPSAVKSSKEQSYKNILCVIDDGSTCDQQDIINSVFIDGIPEYVLSLPNKSGTLLSNNNTQLFLMKDNRGPSCARNLGISYNLNTTDYFMILDADDVMLPNKIETMINVAKKDQNIGVVYADYVIQKKDYSVIEFKKPYDKELLKKECIIHSGSLVSKSVFDSIGLYDESLRVCEDYDLWLRMSNKFLAIHIPEVLTVVRDHENNSTNTVNKSIWEESWRRINEKYL